MAIIRRISQMFEDQDGTISMGKVSFFMSLLTVIGCGIHVLIKTHVMPDWGSGTVFVSSIYGLHGAKETIQAHPSWQSGGNASNGNNTTSPPA